MPEKGWLSTVKLRYSKRIAKSTRVNERVGSLYTRICTHAVCDCECKREKCANDDLDYVHVPTEWKYQGAVTCFDV